MSASNYKTAPNYCIGPRCVCGHCGTAPGDRDAALLKWQRIREQREQMLKAPVVKHPRPEPRLERTRG